MKTLLLLLLIFILKTPLMSAGGHNFMEKLTQYCTEPDIMEIEQREGYIEVDYVCNGKLHEMIYIPGDESVVIQTEIEAADAGDKILKRIRKSYPDWTIDECHSVRYNGLHLFKFELVLKAVEINVYYNEDGKAYKFFLPHKSQAYSEEYFETIDDLGNRHYNLMNPDQQYFLPHVLREISGLCLLDKVNILCVQDELGSVFKYNIRDEKIEEIFRFTDIGDFEDIAIYASRVFILRSDAAIFSFDLKEYPNNIRMDHIPVQSLDSEGLTYNPSDSILIIACKEADINSGKSLRSLYTCKPGAGGYNEGPVRRIDIKEVNDTISEAWPELVVNEPQFSPSAIAIHPISGNIYILSATDRALAVYSPELRLLSAWPLPARLFYKPEGLEFFPNGDMLISNEGPKDGSAEANILLFKYRK